MGYAISKDKNAKKTKIVCSLVETLKPTHQSDLAIIMTKGTGLFLECLNMINDDIIKTIHQFIYIKTIVIQVHAYISTEEFCWEMNESFYDQL